MGRLDKEEPVRPYIIAHMLSSLDGRIDSAAWEGQAGIDRDVYVAAYEAVHRTLQGDAWIVGRTTMEEFADGQATDQADLAASRSMQPTRLCSTRC